MRRVLGRVGRGIVIAQRMEAGIERLLLPVADILDVADRVVDRVFDRLPCHIASIVGGDGLTPYRDSIELNELLD